MEHFHSKAQKEQRAHGWYEELSGKKKKKSGGLPPLSFSLSLFLCS